MSARETARSSKREAPERPGDRCLVVGYDRGESARAAVDWSARQLPADGRLVVVFAEKPLHAPQSPLSSAAERRRFAGAAIDELLLERPTARCSTARSSRRSPGRTRSARCARPPGATAPRRIVLGSQQHSRVHQAIGTVTSSLLKDSPVPVTVVPSPAIDPLPSDSY